MAQAEIAGNDGTEGCDHGRTERGPEAGSPELWGDQGRDLQSERVETLQAQGDCRRDESQDESQPDQSGRCLVLRRHPGGKERASDADQ